MQRAAEVLEYWFGLPEDPEYGKPREVWFAKGRTLDADIRERFRSLNEEAASGALDQWRDDPKTCLALIILLDQFSRHIFRDQPEAYANDPKALAVAEHALDAGYDKDRMIVEVNFFYLPLTHAEDLDAQRRSVALRQAQADHDGKERSVLRAVQHMEAIEQFGRFPHRNEILGRISTPEEIDYINSDPEAWFVKYLKRPAA